MKGKTVRAGVLYFALVFAVGFALGPIRVLWLVPRVGERMAELAEAPLMLIAIVLAARWTVRRYGLPPAVAVRLGMGFSALGLLLATELSVVLMLRGLTVAEYLASRDPVAGTLYGLMLVLFAVMPLVVARRSLR